MAIARSGYPHSATPPTFARQCVRERETLSFHREGQGSPPHHVDGACTEKPELRSHHSPLRPVAHCEEINNALRRNLFLIV